MASNSSGQSSAMPGIRAADVDRIAKAGGISQADLLKLEFFLSTVKDEYSAAKRDYRGISLTRAQLEDGLEELRAAATQMQTVLKKYPWLEGRLLFFQHVLLIEGHYSGEELRESMNAADVKVRGSMRDALASSGDVLEYAKVALVELEKRNAQEPIAVQQNAAKPASNHLTAHIILFWHKLGNRVDGPPTSDADPLVRFARAVCAFVEGREELSPSATRYQLRQNWPEALERGTPRPRPVPADPDRRRNDDEWRARFEAELLKNPAVAPADAKIFAADAAVDLDISPEAAARRTMREWEQ